MLSQIVHTNPDANASTVPIPKPPRRRKRRYVFSRPPKKGVNVNTAPSKDDDASRAVVSNAPLQTTVSGDYDHLEDGSCASANVLGDPAYSDGMYQLVCDDHDRPGYWE